MSCSPTTAVVNGKSVPRLDMDFVGQPFAVQVTAAHPRPGGPSSGLRDFGGHVSGNVCGLDLTYDVVHEGDHTHLSGFVDSGSFESTIEIHDDKNFTRTITGRLNDQGGTVQLELRKNQIVGTVGQRQFAFGRRGDQYIGWLQIRQSVLAKAIINGAGELWALPPSTQAVVLPALLTCYGDDIEDRLATHFEVGFGGHQTWEARHVSALYHSNVMDEQHNLNQAVRGSAQTLTGRLPTTSSNPTAGFGSGGFGPAH